MLMFNRMRLRGGTARRPGARPRFTDTRDGDRDQQVRVRRVRAHFCPGPCGAACSPLADASALGLLDGRKRRTFVDRGILQFGGVVDIAGESLSLDAVLSVVMVLDTRARPPPRDRPRAEGALT
jgi:hypothetical protein